MSCDIFKLTNEQWTKEESVLMSTCLKELDSQFNTLFNQCFGDIFSFTVSVCTSIPLQTNATFAVEISVFDEDMLERINNVWLSVASKLSNFFIEIKKEDYIDVGSRSIADDVLPQSSTSESERSTGDAKSVFVSDNIQASGSSFERLDVEITGTGLF